MYLPSQKLTRRVGQEHKDAPFHPDRNRHPHLSNWLKNTETSSNIARVARFSPETTTSGL